MVAGLSPLVLDADERRLLGAPAVIWPTGQLGLSLANRWKPGTLFVLVNVYIDESGTHGQSGFMVMAGYAGRIGAWNRFDKKWDQYLRHHGVSYFHAKELNGTQNEYRGWSDTDIARFAQRGVFIADSHAMFGFTVRLDRADWQTHYIGDRKPSKLAFDSMYGLCFRASLKLALEHIKTIIERPDLKINFIVESGHANVGSASVILKQIKDLKIEGVSEYLGTATPGDKKDFPGLQAADGLAYGSWYIEPLIDAGKVGLTPNPPGITVAQAQKNSAHLQKIPYFRSRLDAGMLAAYKADLVEYHEFRREYGKKKYGKPA